MTVIIQSDQLSVRINEQGAELQSILNRQTGIEYLWQGDKTYWGRRAPVLFPIIGRLKEDQYTFRGETYSLSQHGFARDSLFSLKESSETTARFELVSNADTKALYPFDFSLIVSYEVSGQKVVVSYEVTNTSEAETMYYSIGGHPAFNVPLTEDTHFEDYYLAFIPRRSRIQIPLKGPLIDPANKFLAQTNTAFSLKRELFENDALVFETKGKNTFSIRSDKTPHSVNFTFEDYPYVGIWSVPGKEAPFVCIEPWHGIADTVDASGKLEEKLGIQTLSPLDTFVTHYSIEVN